ncbi:MAG: TetR/AcrR family transcriptional regulator C-terminal domain-containing protein, partial [bacterium]
VLVVEAVLAQVTWSTDESADWRDSVRTIAAASWRAVRAHPQAIPLILTRRSRSTAVLEISEALLRGLARSGRKGAKLLIAFRAVQAFVMGFAQAELAGPLSRTAGERPHAVIRRFRALPRQRYPHLIEIATAASASRPEDEFRAGLDLLLNSLSDAAAPTAQRRRSAAVAAAPRTPRTRSGTRRK